MSYGRKLVEKKYTDGLRSVKRWRHNNVIIKKFLWMFKIKFPTKRIFRIFPILIINGMAPVCNLFIERPSYVKTALTYPSWSDVDNLRSSSAAFFWNLYTICQYYYCLCHLSKYTSSILIWRTYTSETLYGTSHWQFFCIHNIHSTTSNMTGRHRNHFASDW